MEKNNYCNKHITQLNVNDENITDPERILQEERRFYQQLYSKHLYEADDPNLKKSLNSFLRDNEVPQITDDERDKCEEVLNEKELLKAIKDMKNGKSPGTDGLTSEFYKFFWRDIKDVLLISINYALGKGDLSIEQKRGIITLIPKKDKIRTPL